MNAIVMAYLAVIFPFAEEGRREVGQTLRLSFSRKLHNLCTIRVLAIDICGSGYYALLEHGERRKYT